MEAVVRESAKQYVERYADQRVRRWGQPRAESLDGEEMIAVRLVE